MGVVFGGAMIEPQRIIALVVVLCALTFLAGYVLGAKA